MHMCFGFSNAQTRTTHGGNQVKIDATPTKSYRLNTMVRSKQQSDNMDFRDLGIWVLLQ
jgi:hypothetical protein